MKLKEKPFGGSAAVGAKRHTRQCSKTNVMRFLFNLLKIKSLYMFRALLAHLQEALHNGHWVYCVRVMSVGCSQLT
jgi:hypothetical protein